MGAIRSIRNTQNNIQYTNNDITYRISDEPTHMYKPVLRLCHFIDRLSHHETSNIKLIVAETQAHNPNRNSNTNQQIITDRS
eukprot:scaffold25165_cov72-Cyclotella_meneghiniana.AAC.4